MAHAVYFFYKYRLYAILLFSLEFWKNLKENLVRVKCVVWRITYFVVYLSSFHVLSCIAINQTRTRFTNTFRRIYCRQNTAAKPATLIRWKPTLRWKLQTTGNVTYYRMYFAVLCAKYIPSWKFQLTRNCLFLNNPLKTDLTWLMNRDGSWTMSTVVGVAAASEPNQIYPEHSVHCASIELLSEKLRAEFREHLLFYFSLYFFFVFFGEKKMTKTQKSLPCLNYHTHFLHSSLFMCTICFRFVLNLFLSFLTFYLISLGLQWQFYV